MCFGKSDFILGIPLPNKACDVTRPKRIDSLFSESIVQVAASKHHSLALTVSGSVFSWGHGRSGRLGHGNEITQPEPVRIRSLLRVMHISCAANHSAAVTSDGALFTWGSDRFGQLGLGQSGSGGGAVRIVTSPTQVESLKRDFVAGVCAGESHTVCFSDKGLVYAWGSNKHHQLGIRPTELTTNIGGSAGVAVPKRVYIDCLMGKGSGTSRSNKFGSPRSAGKTKAVGGDCKVLSVSASFFSTLLLVRNLHSTGPVLNEVYQWGHGIESPAKVHFLDYTSSKKSASTGGFTPTSSTVMVNVTAISAGKYHHVALTSTHCVYTWGLGAEQLGHGSGSAQNNSSPLSAHHQSQPQLVEALLPSHGGGGRVVSIS
eukprot:gene23931-30215_t